MSLPAELRVVVYNYCYPDLEVCIEYDRHEYYISSESKEKARICFPLM